MFSSSKGGAEFLIIWITKTPPNIVIERTNSLPFLCFMMHVQMLLSAGPSHLHRTLNWWLNFPRERMMGKFLRVESLIEKPFFKGYSDKALFKDDRYYQRRPNWLCAGVLIVIKLLPIKEELISSSEVIEAPASFYLFNGCNCCPDL